jgi:hypothetical protein
MSISKTQVKDSEVFRRNIQQKIGELFVSLETNSEKMNAIAINIEKGIYNFSIRESKLKVFNHIIWKYNFGVYTQKKFVTSHYHILRCGKKQPAFYNRAFFNETEKTPEGGSAQYIDMEDVWIIPKEFHKGEKKNINKLPDALVKKLILYSTKQGDTVGDFFLACNDIFHIREERVRKVSRKALARGGQLHACLQTAEFILLNAYQNATVRVRPGRLQVGKLDHLVRQNSPT